MRQFISNTAQVKSYNVQIVINALKALPYGTKTTIAQITGLSVATCNTILNELSVTGEILELEESEYSSVGRPAKVYKFNENYSYICCIYLSYENKNKKLNYAIVNLMGKIIKQDSIIKKSIDYYELENLVQDILKQYKNIEAIGIGIPGVVNQQNIIDICDIEELINCSLAEKLYKKLGKDIIIENDMNSIAYGFYKDGEYEEGDSIAVVAFFKDNWPGSGIIIDGQIVNGTTNFAGEVSYLPLGYSHDKQKEILRNRTGIIDIVTKTICSLTAIINPKSIIMTGTLLSEELLREICEQCKKIIPLAHMPDIKLDNNYNKYYLKGISEITLEHINNPIRKTQKINK